MTALLPRLSAEPVDSARARLDPPTTRLPLQARPLPVRPARARPTTELPRQYDPAHDAPHPLVPTGHGASDGPVPARQSDTSRFDAAQWVFARLHAARDAGHGDDREGDRLAGNLMAAARLRATPVEDLFDPDARAEQVRAIQERSDRALPVPEPTTSELSDPGLTGAGLPVPESPTPESLTPESLTPEPVSPETSVWQRPSRSRPRARGEREDREGALLTAEPDGGPGVVPGPRADTTGSRTGVERCGRGRGRHSAHDSAANPIVATAAASVRGGNPMRRRRRPTHGLHYRDSHDRDSHYRDS